MRKDFVIYFELGEIIKIYRERANLSKIDVAKHLGVTAATITNYEKGRTPLTYKKILKFKQLFDEDFAVILNMINEDCSIFTGQIII